MSTVQYVTPFLPLRSQLNIAPLDIALHATPYLCMPCRVDQLCLMNQWRKNTL